MRNHNGLRAPNRCNRNKMQQVMHSNTLRKSRNITWKDCRWETGAREVMRNPRKVVYKYISNKISTNNSIDHYWAKSLRRLHRKERASKLIKIQAPVHTRQWVDNSKLRLYLALHHPSTVMEHPLRSSINWWAPSKFLTINQLIMIGYESPNPQCIRPQVASETEI